MCGERLCQTVGELEHDGLCLCLGGRCCCICVSCGGRCGGAAAGKCKCGYERKCKDYCEYTLFHGLSS